MSFLEAVPEEFAVEDTLVLGEDKAVLLLVLPEAEAEAEEEEAEAEAEEEEEAEAEEEEEAEAEEEEEAEAEEEVEAEAEVGAAQQQINYLNYIHLYLHHYILFPMICVSCNLG